MHPRALALSSILAAFIVAACTSPHTTVVKRNAAAQDGGSGPGTSGGDDTSPSGGGGAPATDPVPMTVTRESMQVSGSSREYLLAVPQSYDASRSYPLVVALHGNPGTADEMLAAFPFDFTGGAVIVAYPQAQEDNWDLATPAADNQDMEAVQALPSEIATKVHVDTSRVFGLGFSGGAFFLNQITCQIPGIFRAFASHSGGAPFQDGAQTWPNGCVRCAGSPTPAIMIHGSADTEVSPDSSKFAASCWATTDGCLQDPDRWPTTSPSMCRRESTCAAASPVELCLVDGLGHAPWGDAGSVAWAFFRAIP
jgi:polyhydroxybutyrate depolymerase